LSGSSVSVDGQPSNTAIYNFIEVASRLMISDVGTDAVEGTSSIHVCQVLREQAQVGVHCSRVHRLLRGTTFSFALLHLLITIGHSNGGEQAVLARYESL